MEINISTITKHHRKVSNSKVPYQVCQHVIESRECSRFPKSSNYFTVHSSRKSHKLSAAQLWLSHFNQRKFLSSFSFSFLRQFSHKLFQLFRLKGRIFSSLRALSQMCALFFLLLWRTREVGRSFDVQKIRCKSMESLHDSETWKTLHSEGIKQD